MANEFLGRGWKFPVGPDSAGEIMMSEYEKDIKETIVIILSTAKGERAMRPDFGCGIHDYVYAVLSSSVLGLIESSVSDALVKWEPRIDLDGVKADTGNISNGQLLIQIDYRVRATNNKFNLVYPFYLKESR